MWGCVLRIEMLNFILNSKFSLHLSEWVGCEGDVECAQNGNFQFLSISILFYPIYCITLEWVGGGEGGVGGVFGIESLNSFIKEYKY